MPSVQDFKNTSKKTKENKETSLAEEKVTRPKNARRPGKEAEPSEIRVVEVEEAPEQVQASAAAEEAPRVEVQFYGSEVLRARFPKPFELVESVATDWVNDGKFEGLPVGHPLLQFFVAKALQKAKEVEKNVMNSPITEKIAMKVFEAGIKAQGTVRDLKSQVEEIRNKVKGGK
jgi:hypothetical protein